MPNYHAPAVHRLEAVTEPQLQSLAELLLDAVDGGASVSFMHPLPVPRALAFWRGVADGVASGERALFVAEDAEWRCWHRATDIGPTRQPAAPR